VFLAWRITVSVRPVKTRGKSGDTERLVGRSLVSARVCPAGHSPSRALLVSVARQGSPPIVIGLGHWHSRSVWSSRRFISATPRPRSRMVIRSVGLRSQCQEGSRL
jgi:hypothetical protein